MISRASWAQRQAAAHAGSPCKARTGEARTVEARALLAHTLFPTTG